MRSLNRSTTPIISIRVTMLALLVAVSATSVQGGVFELESRQQTRVMKAKIYASQFLSRATFGPTTQEIDDLATRMTQVGVRRACDEWIEDQFDLPASSHQQLTQEMYGDDGYNGEEGNVWIQRFRYHSWWDIAINGEDQLRQRLAWALSQILVTSEDGAGFNDRGLGRSSGLPRWLGPSNYYDTLVNDAFGNYRDLLQDVTYHPVMGVYLSHVRNRKTNGTRFPDENYAREILQLFTIGLYELAPDGSLKTDATGALIPTYDNDTVREFARVFTGLTYKPSGSNFFFSGNDLLLPMEMFQNEHDTEPKTLLNNETISITDGDADISAALDNIFAHPNVAPFVSYRLIQRLVKSNPSRAYIRRVSAAFEDNGQGVKGDLKAVVKAILLDPEAWRSVRIRTMRNPDRIEVLPRGTEFSKLKEPVIRYTSLLRGLNVTSDYHTGRTMVVPMDYHWTQEPYKSPTVFNFFLPSYQPPGDLIGFEPSRRIANGTLVAPEFQQKTAVTSNRLMNRYIGDINRGSAFFRARNANYSMECHLTFDLDDDRALTQTDDLDNVDVANNNDAALMPVAQASNLARLLDKYDLLFCQGTMPQDFKDKIALVVLKETDWMNTNATWADRAGEFRVTTALIAVTTSPFAAIEE